MKRASLPLLLTLVGVLPRCMQSTDVRVDDTEVAVSNRLTRVRFSENSIADSVHVTGLRVGDVSFGTVRAGVTTGYRVTGSFGTTAITADSLIIFVELCAGLCYTARYAIDAGGPYYATLTRYERNLVVLDTSLIPIRAMFGRTRLVVRNALARVRIGSDSVKAAVLHGMRVGSVSFGTLDTSRTSDTLTIPDSTRLAVRFDSVVVTTVTCFGAGCRDNVWVFPDVTPFTVPITRYVTNAVAFTASSAATDSLFAHLGTPRP